MADCGLTRSTVSIITFASSAHGKIMRRNHLSFFILHFYLSLLAPCGCGQWQMTNGKWKRLKILA
jgi:hypothetical protein